MKQQIVGILIICFSVSLFSQTTDSLVRKGFRYYYYGEKKLSSGRAVDSVLSICPLALQKYKAAKGLGVVGALFLCGGSLLITRPMTGSVNAGGTSNRAVFLGTGIASYGIGVGIIFGSRSIKRDAIASFNAGRCKVEPKQGSTGGRR